MPASADALDPAELAALHEAANDLHVRPVPVVHAYHHDAVAFLRRADDALDGGGVHRERLFDQHMEIGRQRGENVRFVKMVGRADDDGIERLEAQHVLDVVERILDAEAIGEGAGLRKIGVTDRLDVDRLEFLEDREVGDLGDGAAPDDADTEALARRRGWQSSWFLLSRGARARRPSKYAAMICW